MRRQDQTSRNADPLGAPRNPDHPNNSRNNSNSNDDTPTSKHVKTYTAGEDGSRLAQAAKELGLQQARKPRRQVRKQTKPTNALTSMWAQVLEEATATEDARIRSVYISHSDFDRDFFVQDSYTKPVVPEGREQLAAFAEEEEGEGVSELEAHGGAGGNLTAAVLGIIKGMVGPAILYLPHGFANAGFLVAIPIMFLCTFMFLYSSNCLLETWKLQNIRDKQKIAYASETTNLVTPKRKTPLPLSYPELAYRALGPSGETLVKTGIALMQSGVCLTYLIFVPQNLHTSVKIMTGWVISPQLWLILMVALQVPLSWVRDIRKLTVTNLLANALILYGLTVCLGYAFSEATSPATPQADAEPLVELERHIRSLQPFASGWFLFIGTSVLLFEGSITLLVPLQESVQSEEQRKQFPSVYKRVILGIICFYLFFGIANWMAFGSNVKTVLTTSLPDGLLATSVQLAYSLAVIFTFPLQNFPALEIACRTIASLLASGNKSVAGPSFLSQRNVISSCLVCLLALVAVATMESLDKVVSLMGSLLGCPIAFVFPPMIHSRLDSNISTARLWGNRSVATVGVIAMAYSAFTTIATWNTKH